MEMALPLVSNSTTPERSGSFDVVAEDGGAGRARGRVLQHGAEAVAVEDVVAEDEADLVAADEVFADEKCLREAVGARVVRRS